MKAQTGLETLIIVSISIVILVFAFVSYISKGSEVEFTRSYLQAQKICYEIKNIINQVASDSFGTIVKFNLPQKLETSDYNVTIDANNKTITIEWSKNLFSCTILSQNVTKGTQTKFLIDKGDNVAKNFEGNVNITSS